MILIEAGEAFLRHCQLERHLAPNTLAAYRQDVAELVRHFGSIHATAVSSDALVAYTAHLTNPRGLAPATVKRRLACARGLFRWLTRVGHLTADPFAGTEIRVRMSVVR
ncbi:site-specific integrase [Methylobacterium bullatum]|uniref:Tyrosine recombinase XerD n=1 Tax=Methylobacterium bullatum TaxID=570505 RepID=A0A679JQK7_9HYPH|nr:Tyrosine recombinase XerD [Methylobacterium bullatum]